MGVGSRFANRIGKTLLETAGQEALNQAFSQMGVGHTQNSSRAASVRTVARASGGGKAKLGAVFSELAGVALSSALEANKTTQPVPVFNTTYVNHVRPLANISQTPTNPLFKKSNIDFQSLMHDPFKQAGVLNFTGSNPMLSGGTSISSYSKGMFSQFNTQSEGRSLLDVARDMLLKDEEALDTDSRLQATDSAPTEQDNNVKSKQDIQQEQQHEEQPKPKSFKP